MLHSGELFGAGPGDREEECGFFHCFYLVADGAGQSIEVSGVEVVGLALDGDSDVTFKDLDGDGAVGVVLFHVGGGIHSDEYDSEVVLLEEGFGVVSGLPWLFLLGVSDLFEKVELGHFVDHGAVLLRSCHIRAPLPNGKFTPSAGLDAGKGFQELGHADGCFIYLRPAS